MQSLDYKAGNLIEYAAFGGERRIVRVTVKEPDIKNGRPGFDGVVESTRGIGQSVWGYDSQITRIVARGV